ncbi:LOW QUALITY PROTEIN: hypothetical protein TorRG33x02_292580 [Trema orientale]|uniref:Uncharacterized protein n=1 Tax=Trema orientale TaxID=63057 RepID=A0A2P5CA73_TREOI|nr:LOW QUALITY PROTEIN: hypothetical protein TorRG33x02_292580 [Trema orientale]
MSTIKIYCLVHSEHSNKQYQYRSQKSPNTFKENCMKIIWPMGF